MSNETLHTAELRMKKSIQVLKEELSKVRTGRAHPSLLEHVEVPYYGNDTPLNQVANITVESARALTVTPWEKSMISPVEKAIRDADLGLNPVTVGNIIRVPLPQLTEERRKELVRIVRDEAEKIRVVIRNIRRDANTHFKQLTKEKAWSEDDEKRALTEIQKSTDKYIAEIDQALVAKESDLMEI